MGTDFRVWLLTSNHCHLSTTKIERSPATEDFTSWFRTNGGYLHPSLEIVSDGNDGNCVRVKHGHILSPGSTIVSCPHDLTISWPIVNQHHFPHVHSTFTPHVATRLFLIKQRLMTAQSPWWPYINSLPRSFRTPLWYDEDELIWLRGTNLGHAKEIREGAWRQEYKIAMQSLFADASTSEQRNLWTWELYLWAATVITTRSFAGPASFNSNAGDCAVASDSAGGCPILIPGLDLLNHNPSAKVTWIWNTNSCALRAEESIDGGCQVWNNYNPKSNEELIMGYGFSLPENPSDHYSVGFSPAIAAYIKATKARRLAIERSSDEVWHKGETRRDTVQSGAFRGTLRSGGQVLESSEDFDIEEILDHNIHWVRLLDNGSYEFSPHFLDYFSIAVENPREAHRADDCSAYRTDISKGGFSRNKLHVICAVIMILQKGRRKIRNHDKDLPEVAQNSKQVDVVRYRNSQLKILDNVLESMYTLLKSITTVNLPETSHPRVLQLEHILTTSPKSLLKDLRGVLNAGMRTRDPVKIRERGGVDFAFTAWLCGLWIYSQSGTKDEDEISPTFLQWIQFLQQNYAEPSEERTDHFRPQHPVLGEKAEWFDPVRNANGDAGVESTSFATSYLDAVRAAAEKRPQSVYNDKRITVRRLEWCLNIVRNEGVWCPSVDPGEDEEDDDWVMFLESADQSP